MINQEFFKEHENLKHCKVYRKIMLPWKKKQLLWLSVFSTPCRVSPWMDILR